MDILLNYFQVMYESAESILVEVSGKTKNVCVLTILVILCTIQYIMLLYIRIKFYTKAKKLALQCFVERIHQFCTE